MNLPFRARPLALFVCYGFSGAVAGGIAFPVAAQGLSPLRVDPVLLGLPPAEPPKPAPVPSPSSSPLPAARSEVKPVVTPAVEQVPLPAPATAPATDAAAVSKESSRASTGVAPARAAPPEAASAPVVRVVTPVAPAAAASLPAAVAPVATRRAAREAGGAAAAAPVRDGEQTTLAPLRVDPALLGLPAAGQFYAVEPPVGARSAGAAPVATRQRRAPSTAAGSGRPAAAAADASWYQKLWRPVQNVWDVGTLEFYLPFHTYHRRSSYTAEQIAGYQEKPFGFGVGRGLYNEKGNWEGLYAMGFQDSHFKPQYMAGYGWKTFWRPAEDLRLGLGYTAFLMARTDVFGYVPFPGIVPIASISYKNLNLETTFVPGAKGAGNIFFFWFKWELGKPGEAIGTPAAPAPASPQEDERRPEFIAGPYRTQQSVSAAAYASLFPTPAKAVTMVPAPVVSGTGSERPLLAASSELLPPLVPATGPRDEEEVPDDLPPLALRKSKSLASLAKNDDQHPVFITAERMYGQTDTEAIAEGDAELRKVGTVVNADTLTYWPVDDELDAAGDVLLKQGDDVMSGPHLRLRLQDQVGYFEQPAYTLKRQPKIVQNPSGFSGRPTSSYGDASSAGATTDFFSAPTASGGAYSAAGTSSSTTQTATYPSGLVFANSSSYGVPGAPLFASSSSSNPAPRAAVEARGEAERIDFEGENQVRITDGTYTTCKPGNDDWYASAGEMKLDYDREVGEGRDGTVYFKGVPILYSPWLSFPLNNQRKSGFLAPTFGSTSQSGFDLTLPYYWNIAPNLDATISPRVLSKRGVQLNTEVRYLDYGYSGEARLEMLPNDAVRNENRYGLSLMHRQTLAPGLAGMVNYNRVSDDNYYTDLSSRITNTSQTQLLRQGMLSWAPSGWWNTTLNVQSYQTLQPDPTVPVVKPYNLMPQISFNARKPDWYTTDSSLFGQYTSFSNPDLTRPEAKRFVVYPQVALPIISPGWYVTPKIGVHSTNWSLTRQALGSPDTFNRTLPVFSVDAGMTFERPFDWFGKGFTQTLEPRLFYLNVPYQDQSKIPIFDSGLADFNFAQIFAENQFTGQDRFNDANQLTAAVSSRLIAPDSGREVMRAMLGQRYYFSDQRVSLNDTDSKRVWTKSDLLAAFSGEVAPKIYADAALQYNIEQQRNERMTLGGRYLPDVGKVFNAAYRFNRDQIKQVDVSGQWPIRGGWYAVGRMNYSLKDQKPIENVAGFEYNGGCWVVRVVGQRLATTTGTASSAFFVQLELNDFSRIGSNPLEMLKRSIQGYGRINQPVADPVFGQ